jgi:hypothetical protein
MPSLHIMTAHQRFPISLSSSAMYMAQDEGYEVTIRRVKSPRGGVRRLSFIVRGNEDFY